MSRGFSFFTAEHLKDLGVGEAICRFEQSRFDFNLKTAPIEAVPETLRCTTLGEWSAGDEVNLERSLRLDQRLGGHLVQGHVDGVGTVATVAGEGAGRRVRIELPQALRRFVAEKGSLAVDGVSLTVAGCRESWCEIAYIPHTLEATLAGGYRAGRRVNLEVDLMARYAARLLEVSGRLEHP